MEFLPNLIASSYFSTGTFIIFYICQQEPKKKTTLMKINTFLSYHVLFLLGSFCIISHFPIFQNQISHLITIHFFWLLMLSLLLATPCLLIFSYFYYQNLILGLLDEDFHQNKLRDAAKITFLILLSIFSFFVLSDFFFEYFLTGVNFRMGLIEKLIGFLMSFALFLCYFHAGKLTIQGVILEQAVNLKRALSMQFEIGIFKENEINEEIGVNSDELQSMIEKYRMTGNKLNKKEKQKMNELISKQNLLVHRKKLTNQFVTKKAKILNFFAKILYIFVNSLKIFFGLVLIFSLAITVLRNFYSNEKIFSENPLDIFIGYMVSIVSLGLNKESANILCVVFSQILLVNYILYHTKSFFLSEKEPKFMFLEEKEKKIRDIEKELEDVKKFVNLISLSVFALWISYFLMPKYSLFLPNQQCDFNLWQEENFVLLKKKCKNTILGEIYLIMMQRKELKVVIMVLNVFFLIRMLVNLLYGFFHEKQREELKMI